MERSAAFEAIGTRWAIDVFTPLDAATWRTLEAAIHERIEQFDAAYSRFRPDSLVNQIAASAGSYALPQDGAALLDFYRQLYDATDGLVTPLIGKTVADAGYDASYSLRQTHDLEQPPAWDDVINYSHERLTAAQPTLLDFGAAGKGYLIDLIGELLAGARVRDFVINAGGDILRHATSDTVATIGLENPLRTDEAIGTVALATGSLCASSGSRRSWGKYHHIINPVTLESPADILATWVLADTAMQADGLATALFFVPPDRLTDFTFDYAILRHDMNLTYSKTMPLTIFGE